MIKYMHKYIYNIHTYIYILGFIFLLVVLISMIGNLMVIMAITTNRSLQLPCNTFLASLALADLGVSSAWKCSVVSTPEHIYVSYLF